MNSKWNMILRLIAVFVAGSLLSGCSTSAMPSATAIETPASGPFTKSIAESPPPGSLVEETEHFTIYYPEGDESSANFIGIVLEDHLMRTSMDLGFRPQEKVKVYIYPDLGVFHETIELPEAPEWVVATGYGGGIQMVTPRLISTYLFEKTIVHELTHSLQGEINP